MQVQRLESLLGQRVLQRGKGGAVQLTPHGQYLLERSRDLLALNDEIWTAFHAPAITGTVCLGTPDDYAFHYLPAALKRFADSHPSVEVNVLCLPSSDLVERLRAGDLDMTLCSEGHEPDHWPAEELWRGPLRWVGAERNAPDRRDPLPLAVAAGDCAWRRVALRALERAGRRHRIGYTSATLAGTFAPVLAGLAVTVSPLPLLPPGLRVLAEGGDALPPLADAAILLLRARERLGPVAEALAEHIVASFGGARAMRPEASVAAE